MRLHVYGGFGAHAMREALRGRYALPDAGTETIVVECVWLMPCVNTPIGGDICSSKHEDR